jgi:hypothetical protein
MKCARIQLQPSGWEIDILPATQENEEYVERLKELSAPHQLAIQLERMSDELANSILAQAFAETVIEGSPTPGLPDEPDAWHAWLLEHPVEMELIVSVAQAADDWEEMAGGTSDTVSQPV